MICISSFPYMMSFICDLWGMGIVAVWVKSLLSGVWFSFNFWILILLYGFFFFAELFIFILLIFTTCISNKDHLRENLFCCVFTKINVSHTICWWLIFYKPQEFSGCGFHMWRTMDLYGNECCRLWCILVLNWCDIQKRRTGTL